MPEGTEENHGPLPLPAMIADNATVEIQTRHPNTSLELYRSTTPFGTFSVFVIDDSKHITTYVPH